MEVGAGEEFVENVEGANNALPHRVGGFVGEGSQETEHVNGVTNSSTCLGRKRGGEGG